MFISEGAGYSILYAIGEKEHKKPNEVWLHSFIFQCHEQTKKILLAKESPCAV